MYSSTVADPYQQISVIDMWPKGMVFCLVVCNVNLNEWQHKTGGVISRSRFFKECEAQRAT